MNQQKTRSSLYGIVAAYLLYIAYGLFRDRNSADTTMTPAARILFIALFVLAAGALLVYAWRTWKQGSKEEDQPPEDKTSLK